MKIQTLFELVEPTVSHHNYKKKFQDKIPIGKAKELGAGAYSRVVTDPNDPHMVRKHNHTPLMPADDVDAYRLFVDKLVEKGLINKNPYFPRIYSVSAIKDTEDKKINSYQMEKLLGYDDVSIEEIQSMTERIFNDPNIKNNFERSNFISNNKSEQYKLHRRITDHIEQAVERQDFNNIKDPIMVKALQNLIQIIEELNSAGEKVIVDLNPGNIMYRRTKYGLQPVISDPLA